MSFLRTVECLRNRQPAFRLDKGKKKLDTWYSHSHSHYHLPSHAHCALLGNSDITDQFLQHSSDKMTCEKYTGMPVIQRVTRTEIITPEGWVQVFEINLLFHLRNWWGEAEPKWRHPFSNCIQPQIPGGTEQYPTNQLVEGKLTTNIFYYNTSSINKADRGGMCIPETVECQLFPASRQSTSV